MIAYEAPSKARKSSSCSSSDSAANIGSSCGSHGMLLSQKPLRKNHIQKRTSLCSRLNSKIPLYTTTKFRHGNYQMPCCKGHRSRRRCRIRRRPGGQTGPAAASSGPSDPPLPAALPACAPPAPHIPLQPHSLTGTPLTLHVSPNPVACWFSRQRAPGCMLPVCGICHISASERAEASSSKTKHEFTKSGIVAELRMTAVA